MKEKIKMKNKYYIKLLIRNLKRLVKKKREINTLYKRKAKSYIKKNNIEIVNLPKKDLISINLIGKSSFEELDKVDYKDLKKDLINSDLNLIDVDEETISIKDIVYYGHSNNDIKLFNFGGNIFSYISYTPKNRFKSEIKYLKTLICASELMGATFTVVYISNYCAKKSWYNFKFINKQLGSAGANYIVYTNKTNNIYMHTLKTYRYDRYTYSIKSLGSFIGPKKKGSIVHIDVNLENIKEFKEYYIPYKIEKNALCYLTEKKDKNEITYFNKSYENLKIKERVLTLKQILDVLGLECPKEYSYLLKTGINKICGRTSGVAPNDILFLIEPFNDKNDKYVASTKERRENTKKAINLGALFIISYTKLDKKIPHIVCSDVREAHVKICSYLHSLNNVKTIGITGSVGKTTTKDMLGSVLSQKFNVNKSSRNANVQVKMGMHIQKIQPINEIFIQEIGGGRPGGSSRHSRMINPDIALVTNVGTAHLGNFESQKDLMLNKLGVMDGFKKDSIFYLNLDDENLKDAKIDGKHYTYSIIKKEADYYASDIIETGTDITFKITNKKSKEVCTAHLNVPGLHNVLNAVVCYAVADNLGLKKEEIIKGLEDFRTNGIRQNLITIANQKFMVDCYNASLDSVLSSMKSFDKFVVGNGGKKIVVIGDVTGAGDETENIHRVIAHYLKNYDFDKIILYGDFIKVTSNDLRMYNKEHIYLKMNESHKLTKILTELIEPNDVVLLKGSSKVLLEYHLDKMYGTSLSEVRFTDALKYMTIPLMGFKYRLFSKYASVLTYNRKGVVVKPLNNLLFKKVRSISNKCFKNNKSIKKVILSSNHVHLGDSCFKNCINLEDVVFKNVKMIGKNAFSNCISLEKVVLNDGILHISAYAFSNCKNLREIVIPDSIKQIEENTFVGCDKLIINCSKDSYAYKYAHERNIDTK